MQTTQLIGGQFFILKDNQRCLINPVYAFYIVAYLDRVFTVAKFRDTLIMVVSKLDNNGDRIMKIACFLGFILLFAAELFAIYDIVSSSKRKTLSIIVSIAILVVSFFLVYVIGTVESAWNVVKIVLIIIGAVLLLSFIVGNIIMFFKKKATESIAGFFWSLCSLALFFLPTLLPPFLLFAAIGVIKM